MRPVVPVLAACALGALVGVFYTLSPISVWFAIALIPVLAWARRGLGRRERLWVTGLLVTAVTLRLLALAIFFLVTWSTDGSFAVLIPDEGYIALRARLLRYAALGIPLGAPEYVELVNPYGETGLHEVLGFVQLHLGGSPYAIRLVSVLLYLIGSVAMYRVARVAFGKVAALGGLAVVLFLPSMGVWSISILKEPVYHFLTAMAIVAAMAMVRGGSLMVRVLGALCVAASVLAAEPFRTGGTLTIAAGILGGLVLAAAMRRPKMAVGALVLGAAVAGVAYAQYRPAIQVRTVAAFTETAKIHAGYVHTSGWNYKVLDPGFYTRVSGGTVDPALMTPERMARYAISAVASFLLVPLPWMAATPAMLVYLPEQMTWYLLLMLGAVGVVAGARKDPCLTLILACIVVVHAVVIGLVSGNIGTLVRHRSVVMVALPWLGALGACAVLQRLVRRGDARRAAPAGVSA